MKKHKCDAREVAHHYGQESFEVIWLSGKWRLFVCDGEYGCPITFCPWCGEKLK